MDWQEFASAFIKVWRETGMGTWGPWGGLVLVMSVLAWKALDSYGKRQK